MKNVSIIVCYDKQTTNLETNLCPFSLRPAKSKHILALKSLFFVYRQASEPVLLQVRRYRNVTLPQVFATTAGSLRHTSTSCRP